MYLKISNRGSMSRDAVRLVGFTTKYDEPVGSHVIGQWGTGTAFATVAALRLGLDVAIASNDLLGPYVLRFEIEETTLGDGKTADEIMLNYWVPDGEGGVQNYRIPWNISLTAFRDWDKPMGDDDAKAFKVLREFICNARDEDLDFTIGTVEEQTFAPEGHTCVFITRTDEIDEVLDRPERYFKFLAKDLAKFDVPGIGFLAPKSEKGMTRLFVQGVLASCETDIIFRSSLFDYGLDDRRFVSEDRTIKRYSEYRSALGRLIIGIGEESLVRGILEHVLAGKAETEKDALGTVTELDAQARIIWLKALHDLCKWDRLCIASGNTALDEDARQLYGSMPIKIDYVLHGFFSQALGLPHARELVPVITDIKRLRFDGFSARSQRRFRIAFRVFARFFPERAYLPVVFYLSADETMRKSISAFAGTGKTLYEEIWIAAKSETELHPFTRLLSALMHESRHCVTKADDYDRRFTREAEREMFVLMARLLGRDKDLSGQALPVLGDPDKLLPTIVDPPEDEKDGGIDIDPKEFE